MADSRAARLRAMDDERFRAEAANPGASDLKSRLQEWAESKGMGTPVYEVVGSGPPHAQRFEATVVIGGIYQQKKTFDHL